ncbi:MAG: hypothetical protein WCK30_06200, partial [Actinomycetes bacterium]
MKRIISLVVASALGLTLISLATPANAVASVHTVTPTTQDPGKSITIGASVPIPTTGVSENVITHTWPASRLAYIDATAPDGWLIEYKTASGWSATRPSDLSTLEGIRTTGTIDSLGVLNGKQQLQTTANSTPIIGKGDFAPSGRGDGWGAFTSPKYLLNVYHHDGNYRLECHLKSNGELCGDLYTVSDLKTSNLSDGVVVDGKAYSFVVNNNSGAAAIVCTNVADLPFTDCGLTEFPGTYLGSAQQGLSSQSFDGRRIWAVDFSDRKLLCFDTNTGAPCSLTVSSSLTGAINPDNGYSPGYTAIIAGKIFITGDKTWCVVASTGADCSGDWPVSTAGQNADSGVIAHVTNGVQDGVCQLTNAHACFDFSGASISTPPGLDGLLSGTSTKLSGGEGYWQTTAWNGNKVVWQSNPNGENWSSGTATCYDWSIDAACVGFDTTVDVGGSRYSVSLDAQNSNCVLFNGDSGDIYAVDLDTGLIGCTSPEAKAVFSAKALAPSVSCVNTGNIHTFDSIKLQAPQGLTVADLTLTVQDGNKADVANFVDLAPDANGVIDLSSLNIDATSNNFRFVVSATGMSQDQAKGVIGTLRYTADLPELCVTLRVKADCPGVWGDRVSFPQASLSVATETSRKPTGGSAVEASQSTTVSVNDATELACASFQGLVGPNGQGVSDGSLTSQIVAMAWSPDGQLYVGGVFANAGGDESADYLARWNGTNWEAVGPTGNAQDGFNSAITGRVAALAFDKTGNLIVGGQFSDAAGLPMADYLAIYNPTTNTWQEPGVTQPFSYYVRSISVNPTSGNLVVTGAFRSVNGDNANSYIVQVDPADNYSVSSFNPDNQFSNYIHYSTYGPDKNLYIGGWISGFGGQYAASYNGTDWSSLPQNFNPGDSVRAIAFSGTKMYVGGNFTGVKVYDSSTETWSWLGGSQNAVDGSVRSLLVGSNGDLYIGGNFTNFNSARVIRYVDGAFLPLIDNNTGSEGFDYNSVYGDWGGVWALAESPQGQIYLAGDFQNAGGN